MGTMPDVVTLTTHQEPSTVNNVLVLMDHHPRRVARALSRNDSHIAFGLTLKPPFNVDDLVAEEMEAEGRERSARQEEKCAPYIRKEIVLPDELQGVDWGDLYACMCGDAVVIFQAIIACNSFICMD